MISENPVKSKIKNGEPVIMAFCTVTDSNVPELMAMCGIDIIVIDNEHMAFTDQQILSITRAVTAQNKACLLRTAVKDIEYINRFMEFGISGICATRCGSVDDANKIINAVKYPPIGNRGYHIDGRATGFGFMGGQSAEEYMRFANENTMIFITLEDMNGIRDAEAIAKLKEIDSVHIGPFDLSNSMGFGGNVQHPEVQKVLSETEAIIRAAGNLTGCFAVTPDKVPELIAQGEKCLIIYSEIAILRETYSEYSKAIQKAVGKI